MRCRTSTCCPRHAGCGARPSMAPTAVVDSWRSRSAALIHARGRCAGVGDTASVLRLCEAGRPGTARTRTAAQPARPRLSGRCSPRGRSDWCVRATRLATMRASAWRWAGSICGPDGWARRRPASRRRPTTRLAIRAAREDGLRELALIRRRQRRHPEAAAAWNRLLALGHGRSPAPVRRSRHWPCITTPRTRPRVGAPASPCRRSRPKPTP